MTRTFLLIIAVAIGMAVALHSPNTLAAACRSPDNQTQVTGGKECLVIKTFRSSEQLVSPILFVVLHGDGSGGGPSVYHYRQAAQLAHTGQQNIVAVAMIRPGYYDGDGHTSTGSNFNRQDNYTAENIDDIADAIGTLKTFYKASRVILVGHSGGAATSGVILGRHPQLADAAVLVSCPCKSQSHRPRSEFPDWYINSISPETRVAVLSGSNDTRTLPSASKDYVAALKARAIAATFTLISDTDHNGAFRSPSVIDAALRLAFPVGSHAAFVLR